MTTAAPAQRPFESLIIVPPETPQDKIDGLIEKVKKIITDGEGNLRGIQVWGRRRLAYPIKHHKDGLYIYIDFDGDAKSAKELDELFRLSDFVIRNLTVKREDPPVIKPKDEKPAAGTDAGAAAPAEQPKAEAVIEKAAEVKTDTPS